MANLNEGNLPEAAKAFEAYLKLAPTGQYADQAKGVLGHIQK
jgi:outer membrane protein assembly factor BamD (BamD/ComL family)